MGLHIWIANLNEQQQQKVRYQLAKSVIWFLFLNSKVSFNWPSGYAIANLNEHIKWEKTALSVGKAFDFGRVKTANDHLTTWLSNFFKVISLANTFLDSQVKSSHLYLYSAFNNTDSLSLYWTFFGVKTILTQKLLVNFTINYKEMAGNTLN